MPATLLYCNTPISSDLQQYSKNIYYNSEEKQYYRLSKLPHCTLLKNNDLLSVPTATLLKMDSIFLMITLLYKSKTLSEEDLPEPLKINEKWDRISTVTKI